jgi:hypothetical protein
MLLSWALLRLGVGGFELGRAIELEDRVNADLSDSLWNCGFLSATANFVRAAAKTVFLRPPNLAGLPLAALRSRSSKK